MIAGALEIQLLANIARLQQDMDKAKSIVGNTMGNIDKAVGVAKTALNALGVGLSVNYFVKMIKGSIDAQDELSKMSQRIGVSVQGLAGLEHAAGLSGSSLGGVEKALKTVSAQMVDAQRGLAGAQENFVALGISVTDSTGALKSADAVMIEVADQFAAMKDGTEKTALATKLFGRAGLELIPMLNEGSAGLAALVAEGKKYNPITEESAKQAELFNDNLDRLKAGATGAGTALINKMLPFLAEASERMVAFTNSKDSMEKLTSGFRTLGEIVVIGGALYIGVTSVVAGIAAIGAMAAASTGPLGLFTASLWGTQVALLSINTALGVVIAAFAGWKIGSWLHENFLEARLAGIAFVGAMLTGFEYLKFGGTVLWEAFAHSFDVATAWIKEGYAKLLDVVASGLDAIGADKMADVYRTYAEGMRASAGATVNLDTKVAGLRGELGKNLSAQKLVIDAMVDFEIEANEASSATRSLGSSAAVTTGTINKLASATEILTDKTAELILKSAQQASAARMSEREQIAFNASLEALAAGAGPKSQAVLIQLALSQYDYEQATKSALKANEDAAKRINENAESVVKAQEKANAEIAKAAEKAAEDAKKSWERTHEFLTTTFIDIWDSGGNAFEKLGDMAVATAKRIIAEWLALKAMNLFGIEMPGGGGGGSLGSIGQSIGSSAIGRAATGIGTKALGAIGIGGGAAAAGSASSAAGYIAMMQGSGAAVGGAAAGGTAAAAGGGMFAGLGGSVAALATNPITWAVLGAVALNEIFGHKETLSANAGMLLHDVPGADANQKFAVEPFDSGFAPIGFARREDQGAAIAAIDAFRNADTLLTTMAKSVGMNVSMNNNTFRPMGVSETGMGDGVFAGIASEDGKLNSAPLDAQLEEYIKLWLDGLGGQIGPMAKQDILSAGDAPAMLQRAAELAQGKIDGSHRDGLNYVPYDGYVMEAHEGERLQTNKQARDSDRTAEEVRGLSGKFDRMLIAMNTIAVATGTTSSLLRNVTRDGESLRTTTA